MRLQWCKTAGCCVFTQHIIWHLTRALLEAQSGTQTCLVRSEHCESLPRSNLRHRCGKQPLVSPRFMFLGGTRESSPFQRTSQLNRLHFRRVGRGHSGYGVVPKCLLRVGRKKFERQLRLVRDLRRKDMAEAGNWHGDCWINGNEA